MTLNERISKYRLLVLLAALIAPSYYVWAPFASSEGGGSQRLGASSVSVVVGTDSINKEEITFFNLLNSHRTGNGLAVVVLSKKLSSAASGHSEDMALRNYFSHVHVGCPTPSNPGNCLAIRIAATGYPTNTALGEIIFGHGAYVGETASEAFNAFKSSPGHNGVMLGSSFRAVGIGQAYSSSTHKWYWTADFGGVDDGDNYGGAQDSTLPTVEITDPADGSRVWGDVTITATSTDNKGVKLVEFYLGTTYGFKDNDGTSPYTYSWDSTNYGGSSVTWRAKSYDNYGNTKWSDPVTYTVDSTAPTQSPTPPPTPTPSTTPSPSPTPSPEPSGSPTPSPSPTTPPPTTPLPPMPDLYPSQMQLSPDQPVDGERLHITCFFMNSGSVAAGPFTVLVQMGMQSGVFASIPSLGVGDADDVTLTTNATAGSHTARCTVDYYNIIPETDEENNVIRLNINIAQSPSPTPTATPAPSPTETPSPSPTGTPNSTQPPTTPATLTPTPTDTPSTTSSIPPSLTPSPYASTTQPATTTQPTAPPTSDPQENQPPQTVPVQVAAACATVALALYVRRKKSSPATVGIIRILV